MAVATSPILLIIISIIIISIIILVLQIFLSIQENEWLGLILPVVILFYVVFNDSFGAIIPAMILLGTYLLCRSRLKKKKEIEKMRVRDL